DLRIVSTVLIEPENSRRIRKPCTINRQLYPVSDRCIFGLTHPENIAILHLLLKKNVAIFIFYSYSSFTRDLKSFIVRPIFFSLLSHEPDVGNRAKSFRIDRTVLLHILNDRIVKSGVGTVGNDADGIFLIPFLVPHLPATANKCGHR